MTVPQVAMGSFVMLALFANVTHAWQSDATNDQLLWMIGFYVVFWLLFSLLLCWGGFW